MSDRHTNDLNQSFQEEAVPTQTSRLDLPANSEGRSDRERSLECLPASSSFENVVSENQKGRRRTRRLAAMAIGIVPLGLLLVASQLEPSAQGLGTHQQLGLPPCTARVLFGIRCPGCGMTTSWAYFTHAKFLQSVSVNAGGFLLASFSIIVIGLSAKTCWDGRIPSNRVQQAVAYTSVGILVVTLIDWLARLAT